MSDRKSGKAKLTRREMLAASLTAGGALLVGFRDLRTPAFGLSVSRPAFPGGRYLGLIEFVGEGVVPIGTAMGDGLDGRLYTDLSAVGPDNPITPTDKFYVRTRASDFLEEGKPWLIKVTGLVKRATQIGMAELRKMSSPAGVHLMECSGNVRAAQFGMLSVADWTGTLVSDVFDSVKVDNAASHVLISGFDTYPLDSLTSTPGASWIFSLESLKSSKAFFATEMNRVLLSKDHGAPVRLLVPGWYGCACIKWVDEITLLAEGGATTSQMREFASRTMQDGVPKLVKDYSPAIIEQAAMPIRVEKWLVNEKIKYSIHGIAWGGSRPATGLQIRFNAEEDFVSVNDFRATPNDPWSFWTHAWTPLKTGVYFIQLKVKDGGISSKRLESGHYVRSVEVTEI
jgi:DMSO/TMAO reductase YedYZ molybdopterin-dependent catalytic subunit